MRGRPRQNTERGADGLPNFVSGDAKAFMQKQDSRAKAARAVANAPPPAPPPPKPAAPEPPKQEPYREDLPRPGRAPRQQSYQPVKRLPHETNGEYSMRQAKAWLEANVPACAACLPK